MNKSFVFALLTAVVWGLAPAFEKMGLDGKIDPFIGVVIRTIPIALITFVALFFMGRTHELARIDLKSALLVASGGILAGLVGQFLFYSALKSGEASVVVPVAAIYPLIALVVSILFLGEAITWQKAVGATLVAGGVMLLR
jgi:transporter family protein